MSNPEIGALSPDEKRARDAVRALPRPKADAAFRARLKVEFVSGTITSALGDRATREHSRDAVPGAMRRFLRGPWVMPLAWAAAAAILVVGVARMNHGPRWEVSHITGGGIAVVDGRPLPLEHADEIGRSLRPGASIRVPNGAEIEVVAPGELAIQILSGTELVLPKTPGHWFDRDVAAELGSGELRITTGPRFRGARLMVETPEARVEVTGTTLAVIREPQGTCVCVLEGKVQVGAKGADMAEVVGGHRRFVFNDGRKPEMADMREAERMMLGVFKEEKGAILRGSRRACPTCPVP